METAPSLIPLQPSPQRKLGYPERPATFATWGDPSFHWDDGGGAGTVVSTVAVADAGTGAARMRVPVSVLRIIVRFGRCRGTNQTQKGRPREEPLFFVGL